MLLDKFQSDFFIGGVQAIGYRGVDDQPCAIIGQHLHPFYHHSLDFSPGRGLWAKNTLGIQTGHEYNPISIFPFQTGQVIAGHNTVPAVKAARQPGGNQGLYPAAAVLNDVFVTDFPSSLNNAPILGEQVGFVEGNREEGGCLHGHIVVVYQNIRLTDFKDLPEQTNLMIRHGGQQLTKSLRLQHRLAQSIFKAHQAVGALKNTIEGNVLQQQMHFLGIQPQDYHTLCVLHTSTEHTLSDDRIASQLERCCGATPVFYKDMIVGLFSHRVKPDPLKLEQALGSIHTALNCQVGVSDTFQGFYDFNTYYIQAEWALTAPTLLPSLRNAGPIRYYRDYVSAHILYSFSRQTSHCAVLPPELELLRRYDEENHTELTVTLYRFLALERSMQETAKALFIHRNTLAYRIGKIHELCGFELDNEAVRRRLILALELEALLGKKQT